MNPFLIIQGHTKYVDQVLENVKDVENVIWSTDKEEPIYNLRKISNSNVKLVVSSKICKGCGNIHSGYGNINLQCRSTTCGLRYSRDLGATHAIKIRSDLIFKNPSRFISEYSFDNKIHFMGYIQHNKAVKNTIELYPNLPQWIYYQYGNLISNVSDYNYIVDFSNIGPIEEMIKFWNYPTEKERLRIPAEFKLLLLYLSKDPLCKNIDLSLDGLSKRFKFFMKFCYETKNPLFSLKHGWTSDKLLFEENNIFVS
jgi:hypothetical protein